MDRRVFSLALLVLLAAAPAPARADELATVRARIAQAMHAAKSFVIATKAATGFTVTTTYVAPDRYHSVMRYRGGTREVVLVGATAYTSEGGRFVKSDAPPEVVRATVDAMNVPVDRLLEDVTTGGVTWGTFATTASGPQKDQHLLCSYDKATYRINGCFNEGFTMTFSRYDDPANVVAIPANATGGGR